MIDVDPYRDDEPGWTSGEPDPYTAYANTDPGRGAPVTWGSLNPPQNVPGGWNDEHTGGFTPATSGNAAGYQDLSYWASRGVPADQIMDFATGQPRPGWARTGAGYSRVPVASGGGTTETGYGKIPTTYGSLDGGRYAGGGGFGDGMPDYSQMLPFSPYEAYGPFAAPRFVPSTWEDAENEPGYKASREQLRKQIEAGAAYKGMVRSGMTIGDLYSNLDALSQQNFKAFDDRRFRNFQSDYTGARDVYQFGSTENDRKNNYRFNTEKASFDDVLSRWQEQVRSLTSLARPVE